MATQNPKVNPRRRKRNTRGSGQGRSCERGNKLCTSDPWVDTQEVKMSEASHDTDVSVGKKSRASVSSPDLIPEQVTHSVNATSSGTHDLDRADSSNQPLHSGNPSDEIIQCPNVSQSSDSIVEDNEDIGETERADKRMSTEMEIGARIITTLAAVNVKKKQILKIGTNSAEIDVQIAKLQAEKAKLAENEGKLEMEIEELNAARDSKVKELERKIAKRKMKNKPTDSPVCMSIMFFT